MRMVFLISLLFLYSPGFAVGIDMDKVRVLFEKAAIDEEANKEMLKHLSDVSERNPLLFGYKASATMMMAKYAFSPFSKISYFNKGKKMLERAITVDSQNVELRLLRFMVQKSAPSFLGYTDSIESDKYFILNHISGMGDKRSKQFVAKVLNQSNHLSLDEKRRLNLQVPIHSFEPNFRTTKFKYYGLI